MLAPAPPPALPMTARPRPRTVAARACRVCGCTDDRACPDGCSWVDRDLCSACHDPAHPTRRQAHELGRIAERHGDLQTRPAGAAGHLLVVIRGCDLDDQERAQKGRWATALELDPAGRPVHRTHVHT